MGSNWSTTKKTILCSCVGGVVGGGIGVCLQSAAIIAVSQVSVITKIAGVSVVFGPAGLIGGLVGAAIIGTITYLVVKKDNNGNVPPTPPLNLERFDVIEFTKKQLDEISSISSESYKNLIGNYTCPITSQIMVNCTSLQCGHSFQKAAIQASLARDPRCPICRKPAQLRDIRINLIANSTIKYIREKAAKKLEKRLRQFDGLNVSNPNFIEKMQQQFGIKIQNQQHQ